MMSRIHATTTPTRHAHARNADEVLRELDTSPDGLAPAEAVSDAVAHAACHIASKINAKVIAAVTRTGRTAQRISAARPNLPIVAVVSDEEVARGFVMHRGVIPLTITHQIMQERR